MGESSWSLCGQWELSSRCWGSTDAPLCSGVVGLGVVEQGGVMEQGLAGHRGKPFSCFAAKSKLGFPCWERERLLVLPFSPG